MTTMYTGEFLFPYLPEGWDFKRFGNWAEQRFCAVPDPDESRVGPSGLRAITQVDYYWDQHSIRTLRGHEVVVEMNGTWDAEHMRFVVDETGGPKGGIVYQKGQGNPLFRVPSLHFPFWITDRKVPVTDEVWVRLTPKHTQMEPQVLAHWLTLFARLFYPEGVIPNGRIAWAKENTTGAIRWSLARNLALVYTHPHIDQDNEEEPV